MWYRMIARVMVVVICTGVGVNAFAAKLRVSGDNEWVVYVNGEKKDTSNNWQVPTVTTFSGASVTLGIYVHDAEPGAAGRGGFLADIILDNGTYIGTADKGWKGNAGAKLADRKDGWEKPGFNDSSWVALTIMDAFGAGIWGFGAPEMRKVLNNPDCTSNWAWVGPNDKEDDVYFRYVIGSPATAVEPRNRLAVEWARLKSGQ
jgi:hypothetical protein